ncbi:MAG TPA: hypothetical protein VLG25_02585 [Patescibacteria group bacterium]|nr:hypothetical protein [Patescibacteria group bacterium]
MTFIESDPSVGRMSAQPGLQAEEVEHPRDEGVFNSRKESISVVQSAVGATVLASDVFTHDRLGPIRKLVSGLGRIDTIERQEHRGRRVGDAERADRWYQIELDGFSHGVRVTEADPKQDSGVTIIHFPGFTETIEDSAGRELHDTLAREAPHLRVISIATDGIGKTSAPVHLEDVMNHTLDAMAEQRLKLVQALVGDRPIIIVGTSMGSVIENKLLDFDLRNGHNLNAYPINHASALLTPGKTLLYMGALFMPAMALDAPRELIDMLLTDGPKKALEKIQVENEHHRGSAAALIIQAAGLIKGVKRDQIERVAASYSGSQISGQFDPLAQFRMWREIRRDLRFPEQRTGYGIEVIPWRGHGMAADGEDGAKKILKTVKERQIIERLLAA